MLPFENPLDEIHATARVVRTKYKAETSSHQYDPQARAEMGATYQLLITSLRMQVSKHLPDLSSQLIHIEVSPAAYHDNVNFNWPALEQECRMIEAAVEHMVLSQTHGKPQVQGTTTCTLEHGAASTNRSKSTISSWAKNEPSLVAQRDVHGKVMLLNVAVLHKIAGQKSARESFSTAEQRMERASKRRLDSAGS